MSQNNQNSQNAMTSQMSGNNPPQQSGTFNGVAQPMDPMGGGDNFFATLDSKSRGIDPSQQQSTPTNNQGFPPGTEAFNPQSQGNQDPTPTQQGGSPMDKWMNKPDNGLNPTGAPTGQPAAPVAAPVAPVEYQSIFGQAKLEEFQALVANRDFASQLMTPEVLEAFKGGDFTALSSIINGAVQQGAALSAFMGSKVADKGVSGMMDNWQKNTLPNLMNTHQTENMWKAPEYADFSSPAMQPMVQMATNHVKGMYPNASPQQIQSHALSMMKDMTAHMGSLNFQGNQSQQAQQPAGPTMTAMEQLFSQ